jgi:DNA-directed RNA polymerase specialized sigma24 family protein
MDKLDIILQKLEAIEKHLNIKSKTIYDDMAEAYSIKDTAKILGCSETKVRQYIKY